MKMRIGTIKQLDMIKTVDTLALVKRAKAGDSGARDDLIARYYDLWLDRFHGNLGTTLRSLHSTEDLVHSALIEAMRDIGRLRNEGAFFAWVTMIIKHKIAGKRRRLRQRTARIGKRVRLAAPAGGSGAGDLDLPDPRAAHPGKELAELEEYSRLTETMLDLFPAYPRPMAAVALRYLWGKEIEEVMVQLGGISRRTAWLWLRQGLDLLKEKLPRESFT